MSAAPEFNHLVNEKSPYLQQHVHNPVDWYPWGIEAFELAKAQDKPIFLSIGYATCHWCHVMEKETFQNVELARGMNEVFINIKVDREELPEIDNIYMEFAQALMSSPGGWPLNVVLTPERKPFFAVTYLPPTTRRGMMGMDEFIKQVQMLWQSEERTLILEESDRLLEMLKKVAFSKGDEMPTENHIAGSIQVLFDIADPIFGGIKGAPKFPLGFQANYLLEFAKCQGDSRALFYVDLTLDHMRRGGIYDHLGGGFSRYSVDERWHVPHFEKMSYDNAILAAAYLEAWRYTKKIDYKLTTEEILNYILRDMTHNEGGFYSAEDADTNGHEGLFYTWTVQEIQENLALDEAEIFCAFYGVSHEGNFEGRNVLHCDTAESEFAEIKGIPKEKLSELLARARSTLFKQRQMRQRPFKDDKILSSWNGLMIHSLARAGSAFQNEHFKNAAVQGAHFIRTHLWKEGKLLHRWREGEARFNGVLEDYAFMIKGLLSLFEEGWGTEWLAWAVEMTDFLEVSFKAEEGAFYQTQEDDALLIRKCEFYDGAEPSGNGVHAENLIRLYQITQDNNYLKQAEDILKAAKKFIETYPPGACYHLIALQRYLNVKAPTIVISLNEQSEMEKEIGEMLNNHFCPHAVKIWKRPNDRELLKFVSNIKEQTPIEGKTAVYICRENACQPALTVKEEILKAVEKL